MLDNTCRYRTSARRDGVEAIGVRGVFMLTGPCAEIVVLSDGAEFPLH